MHFFKAIAFAVVVFAASNAVPTSAPTEGFQASTQAKYNPPAGQNPEKVHRIIPILQRGGAVEVAMGINVVEPEIWLWPGQMEHRQLLFRWFGYVSHCGKLDDPPAGSAVLERASPN
ncbi:hypothetical protein K438DRAFT_1779547 [Mycena galopus ATCC 62051]|nr:hypothetical protein K438DRAFT_1779547 [Mycena galopus ATCC 62051]